MMQVITVSKRWRKPFAIIGRYCIQGWTMTAAGTDDDARTAIEDLREESEARHLPEQAHWVALRKHVGHLWLIDLCRQVALATLVAWIRRRQPLQCKIWCRRGTSFQAGAYGAKKNLEETLTTTRRQPQRLLRRRLTHHRRLRRSMPVHLWRSGSDRFLSFGVSPACRCIGKSAQGSLALRDLEWLWYNTLRQYDAHAANAHSALTTTVSFLGVLSNACQSNKLNHVRFWRNPES